MVLGDLGCDVIKVENPDGGDDTRHFGPPFRDGVSAYNMAFNRNKRGIVADFKSEEGQAVVRALAACSDVLIENYRFGTMEKFCLGLDGLRAENPKLITVSISGYGRGSPMAERAGYDFMIQAESGLMSITGEPDGPPVRVGVSIADMLTGHNAAQAVLAALIARGKSGHGQHIDMALFDSTVTALSNVASAYLMDGKTPERHGAAHPSVAPYQPYTTKDHPLALAIANNGQFRTLCKAIGREDLIENALYLTNGLRAENRVALAAELETVFKTAGRDAWLEKLHAVGLPAGAVRTVDEALESPEAKAHELVREVPHPTLGTARILASPIRLSETPVVDPTAPPELGQHTVEVLTGVLGWDKAKAADYAKRLG